MPTFRAAALTALALISSASPVLAAEAVPSPPLAPVTPLVPEAGCPALDPPPTEEDRDRYLCGDRRLGPRELPADGPVGELVEGYDRLGGLTPVEFLDRWATEDGWDYPEHDGFVVEDGKPVQELRKLPEGWMLDRFGSPWGTFLAPAGASYAERALPPDSLNTWPDGPEHNYNCYEVVRPVIALVGPIAPHFEQPGGGEQLLVPAEQVPEAGGEGYVPVNDLLEWRYLEQRSTSECLFPEEFAA
ncbi:TNT domain-containing protein [Nocardiopsis alba]|uniref:Glycohydrolase toxin TNT-related protein n=1 Tax=Nocardiopsis alba TaxID=53437 RepID=A0A7K2IQM5_9ACTN|nr:TNT domain-containing protein [Nocardiopsis alba]MYR32104.1 glycohydrolase toxin TNT-related protein [Nocardiopsis alba]